MSCVSLFGRGGIHQNREVIVTESINGFLCYEDFITNRAVFTLGKSCFGTGGSDCRINNFGVTECINDFLCHKNFITNGTMLAFGQTR